MANILDALTVSDAGAEQDERFRTAKQIADAGKNIWGNMNLLERAALATAPIPILGDVTGLASDAYMYATKPEERTPFNVGMSILGMLPLVPAKSIVGVADDAIDAGYRMAHRPTMGARLDDLTVGPDGDGFFPSDLYSPRGKQIYGTGNKDYDDESYQAIMKAYKNPDAEVTVYRGVPKGVDEIRQGDWVTLSKKYAEDHASSGYGQLGDDSGQVLFMKVKAKDIFSDGNDMNEFGYFPSKNGGR